MGKKLDSVKNKSREGGDSYKESGDLGKKTVSEVKQMKSLIDSLPSDVDDEITNAAHAVSEGTKSDATGYMQSDVSSKLESGRKQMEASSKEASDQIQNNEKVRQVFSQMDNIAGFGKNARSEGRASIDSANKSFDAVVQDNEAKTREAETAFKADLSEISSTF
jgi:hypothetical protein